MTWLTKSCQKISMIFINIEKGRPPILEVCDISPSTRANHHGSKSGTTTKYLHHPHHPDCSCFCATTTRPPTHFLDGYGSQGSTTYFSHDSGWLASDNPSARPNLLGPNCQRGPEPCNRGTGDENLGGDTEKVRNGREHQLNKFFGARALVGHT